MKTATILSDDIRSNLRLDSKYFVDEGHLAFLKVKSGRWPLKSISSTFGSENIWAPNIFTRVYASEEKYGKPILAPYDLFRYLPNSSSILSKSQVSIYEKLLIKRGWLVITCSGRNLGPLTIIDKYTEEFVLSHDMIRISSGLNDDLLYLAAFLHTSVGQALIRRDRNGSVIDHLNPTQVGDLEYPVVENKLNREVVDKFGTAFKNREDARLTLKKIQKEYLKIISADNENNACLNLKNHRRFQTCRSNLIDRIDAEPSAPYYECIKRQLSEAANGCKLDQMAEVTKPAGRYKTIYVEDGKYGLPILSGRQMAQYRTIGLKFISEAALSSPENYVIRDKMVLMTADGRAEENLADCVMVSKDRTGWAASGHMHRITPLEGIHPGLVYLACSCGPVQDQLKSTATGSVVDAISKEDVANVIVPNITNTRTIKLGDQAIKAWDTFAKAYDLEQEAIHALEEAL